MCMESDNAATSLSPAHSSRQQILEFRRLTCACLLMKSLRMASACRFFSTYALKSHSWNLCSAHTEITEREQPVNHCRHRLLLKRCTGTTSPEGPSRPCV